MIDLEDKALSDFVNFDSIMLQRYETLKIQDDQLVIGYQDQVMRLDIQGDLDLLRRSLKLDWTLPGSIGDLKNLPIIDFEYQNEIKNYIDDLVFSLYFNVKQLVIGFKNRDQVQKNCEKHKFYKLVQQDV